MFTFPVASMKSVTPAFSGTIFASGTRGVVIKSETEGQGWVDCSPQTGYDGNLYGLATDGVTVVAYGAGGAVLKSTDTQNWSPCMINTTEAVTAIIYDSFSGVWVAAARDRIYTSPDLAAWTSRGFIVEFSDILSFATDGAKIVAVGANSLVATSINGGVSWSVRSFNAAGIVRMNSVFYANSMFVVVGMGGAVQTSPDGVVWTKRTSGTAQELCAITYFSSMWIVTGANRTILTSTDGGVWSQVSVGVGTATDYLRKVYSNGTTIVATSTNPSVVYRSGNGTTWYTTSMASDYSGSSGLAMFMDVIYDTVSSKWIGAGYTIASAAFDGSALKAVIFTASDLTDTFPWTDVVTSGAINGRTVKTLHSLASFESLGAPESLLALGQGTTNLFYTEDGGATWQEVNVRDYSPVLFSGTSPLYAMWLGQGNIIASSGGSLYRSPDLLNWTKVLDLPSGGQFHPYKTGGFLGSLWLIPAKGGVLAGSIDGVTWVTGTLPTGGADIFQAAFGNGIYVVTSTVGRIYTSTDTSTWTLRQTSSTSNFLNLTFDGTWFYAFTASGQVFKSINGTAWTLMTTGSVGFFENGAQYEFSVSSNKGKIGVMPNQNGLYRTADNLVFRQLPLTVSVTAFSSSFSSAFSGGLTASLTGVQWKSTELVAA